MQLSLEGKKEKQQEVIKSISYNQDEIFQGIIQLYCPNGFELDPTYSKGIFYKNIKQPSYKFDLNPQMKDVKQADCRKLPIKSNSINSIMFDPPFCFGVHGKTKQNISAKRFTMFQDFDALKDMYQNSLKEFYRILKSKGILIFKCQDYTDSKTTMTHCFVYNWAIEQGFYAKDIFILLTNCRIYNPNLKQRHSRKYHSYFWIFEKGVG